MGAKTFFRTALRCTHCGTLNDGKQIDLSNETTDHMSLYEVPRALRAVLEPALSSALADRPDLATFVAELERVAPGLVRR